MAERKVWAHELQVRLRSRIGWQRMNNVGAITSRNSRAARRTWLATRVDWQWNDWQSKLAYITRTIDRHENATHHFYSLDGRYKLKYIATGQLEWQPSRNNYIRYFAGVADQYLLREGIETSSYWQHSPLQSSKMEHFFYHNKGLNRWEGNQNFDRNAYHYALRLTENYHKWTLQAGGSYTRAQLSHSDNMGFFYEQMGKYSRGRFMSPAYNGILDYVNNQEKMFFSIASYQLTAETAVGVTGYYGYGMKYHGVKLKH